MCFTPTQIYEMACYTSLWADEDPSRCGCRGKGWMLSDVDTWHQCPVHGAGVQHPEEADYEAEMRCEIEDAAKDAGMTFEAYLASLQSHDDYARGVNGVEQPKFENVEWTDEDVIPF